ncbi:hypothetical protein B0H67DRAFT_614228 [Lasiosphaeris hirsuta]|uniref:Uncharacterized protein n=1 Tax=Lasiosphaeris hirsuta TaxID=260670 RepID=A0AA39ZRT3_9PEZI|nr:hypothetical protein B0H67DRAFT_614228 [Lasiosphaeris hirsuta]
MDIDITYSGQPDPSLPTAWCNCIQLFRSHAHERPSPGSATFWPPDDVEQCFGTFCNRMLRHFPFMHLPVNLDWVRAERPFLLVCICAASSKSTQTRLGLGRRIKQTVAERLLLHREGLVNIDLLLGLLTFLAWGQDYLLNDAPSSLSRLAQLSMMVVFELQLNRPTHETRVVPGPANIVNDAPAAPQSSEHTLEERRAVLVGRVNRGLQ